MKLSTAANSIIVAMFGALVALLGLWIYESYQTSMRRAEERVVAASKIVSTNASWINALAVQTLQRIDDSLGPALGLASDEVKNLNEAVSNLPGKVQAYVVDRNGRTLFSTDPNIRPIDIRDREYFSAVAKGEPFHVSGLLVSRLNNKQIFVFSKRLERDGVFSGAAMVSFEAELLRDVWEAVSLGENSTVSMIRKDGELVARFPASDGPMNMSSYVLFTDYLPKASSGTYVANSPADGARRVVAYRLVEGTGIVALASADYEAGLAPFRSDLFIAAAVLVLASISSLAAWGWIQYVGKRDAEKSARLEDALEDNRLLLREIHHRVKNNFQGVQSVIRMHQLPADAQKILFDRIGAMIAVHEQIYGRDQFSAIGANDLIPSIVDKLISAYSDNVAARYDIEDFYLDPGQATPVALLVTEVVTNSLKYAYPDGRQGTLTISLRRHGDLGATLVIADDGVGFNPDDVRRGMGSRLIRGVMGQLRGSFEYKFQGGTVFTAQLALIPRK
ncbi:sensor histidine kinase [Ensifer adhaerens]|uniref:sensor histidine kinase n=1 Tax=Ensifer adhaerens TaxID=106592 RepID=UPI001C4DE176|nr:cache domain-containing protein [Ensifer adhaerens]MBW0368001.1 ATP-binding protein [Ensifer adhaerens]UCM23742.1 ATP-binding protein [Ensifer adhaerens]